jgi:hypothetical protein
MKASLIRRPLFARFGAALAAFILSAFLVGCPSDSSGGKEDPPPPPTAPEISLRIDTYEIPNGGVADLGSAVVGTPKDVKLTIWNTGDADLRLTGSPLVAVGGADASAFTVTTSPSSTVGKSNGSSDFLLRFDPASAGAKSGALTIVNNDDNEGNYVISLDADATLAPEPEMNVKGPGGASIPSGAGTYAFASTRVGATATAVFTIENLGTANLILDGSPKVAIAGADAALFSVSAQPATPVNASSSTQFTLLFSPTSIGAKGATLSIANDDADEDPYVFALSGAGTAPEIGVRQGATGIADGTGSYAFASTGVGANVSAVFTIENTGTYALALTGTPLVALGGADASQFSVTALPPASVAASAAASFTLRFAPTSLGAKTAVVTIANDDADESPYDFSISGTATAPEMNVRQGATNIADGGGFTFATTLHTDTTSATFTIENLGNSALSLTGTPKVVLGGADASQFSVSSQPASPVAAGGSRTFAIGFSPTSVGTKNATVSIANDDSNENPYNFTISGVASEWHGFKPIVGSGIQVLARSLVTSGSNIFVSFYDSTDKRLMFLKSTDTGATWTSPAVVVASTSDLGSYSSISAYSSNVYIAYYDKTAGKLMFIRSTDGGSTWPAANIKTVDSGGGEYCSLASNGNLLHISYRGGTAGLKYAGSSDGGSTWPASRVKVLDSASLAGNETSIAVSGNGVYISYQDNLHGYLRFVSSTDSGSTWGSPTTVDSSASVAWYNTSICVDGGNLYIAYYDGSTYDLKFARSADSGATWGGIVFVDTVGEVGVYPSIAVADGTIYIAYRDNDNQNIKLAKSTNSGTTWPGIGTICYGFCGYGCALRASGTKLFACISQSSSAWGMSFGKSLDGGATW